MKSCAAKRREERCLTFPGAVLRAYVIPAVSRSKSELARLLGICQHLHDILAEKTPISPEVAALVGRLFRDGAAPRVKMQAAFDPWHAERNVDVSDIQ